MLKIILNIFQYVHKQSIPIRYILEQLEYKQLKPDPIKTDNSTLVVNVNKNMQMKKSKT